MKYSFDTSAIIDFWEHYPVTNPNFEKLWEWFVEKIGEELFVISDIAKIETNKKDKELFDWLKNNGANIMIDKKDIQDLKIVQDIKDELGIIEDQYHPKGIDENDLFIISIAKRNNRILVSNESIQNNLPDIKSKYKIPAICNLSQVNLECINLLTLLKYDL